jgi:hypothetical protein
MSLSKEALNAVIDLEAAAPERFKTFQEALRIEMEKARDACVKSPLEFLQVNQGRAQALSMLYEQISTARTQVGKLKG